MISTFNSNIKYISRTHTLKGWLFLREKSHFLLTNDFQKKIHVSKILQSGYRDLKKIKSTELVQVQWIVVTWIPYLISLLTRVVFILSSKKKNFVWVDDITEIQTSCSIWRCTHPFFFGIRNGYMNNWLFILNMLNV